MTAPDRDAIDVHLADGGHVIVSFADPAVSADPACDQIVAALIQADGTEHDLETAIVEQAAAGGLSARVSGTHHPTTVVIGSTADVQRPGGKPAV